MAKSVKDIIRELEAAILRLKRMDAATNNPHNRDEWDEAWDALLAMMEEE